MISRRFVKFLIVGGIATLVNFLSRIILGMWLGYITSIVIAYCIGLIASFALNKVFVFEQSTNALHHQLIWFTLVNLAAFPQILLISLLFARVIFPAIGMHWHVETVAHAVGLAVPVFTSYFGYKHLSFRPAN